MERSLRLLNHDKLAHQNVGQSMKLKCAADDLYKSDAEQKLVARTHARRHVITSLLVWQFILYSLFISLFRNPIAINFSTFLCFFLYLIERRATYGQDLFRFASRFFVEMIVKKDAFSIWKDMLCELCIYMYVYANNNLKSSK